MSPIKFDRGTTILVVCTECPGFRPHALTAADAYRQGKEHQRQAHTHDKKMRTAMDQGLKRNGQQ